MLYDESQLARVYLHAWQVTGNEFSRTITEEILDYVVSEMLDPAGGFYSTQNADSEGEEGKFFVWTPYEIRAVLGDEADQFMTAYLIEGLLELYQMTFESRWFMAAQELTETMLKRFADSEGTLYDTSDDHESLITRPRDLQDNAKLSAEPIASVGQCDGRHHPAEAGQVHE